MVQKNKLFVGNLSYDFDEASLRDILTQVFSEYGTVEKIEIPIDRATNRTKGIAFVTMSTDDEATNAQEALDGYELAIDAKDKYPRPMKIDIARPMKPRDNFGGGDRGGRSNYSNNRSGGGRNNYGNNRGNSFDSYDNSDSMNDF